MSKNNNDSTVKLTRKEYSELLLAVVYSIMRSDQAISEARKANKSALNAMKKK